MLSEDKAKSNSRIPWRVPVEIVLVRHAQPDWEPGGLAVDEPGLTTLGRRQAECVAQALKGDDFDAIYLSPMQRVVETAAPTLEALGRKGEECNWLREMGLPSMEGQSSQQVQRYFRDANARELPEWWNGLPGGESFRHFYERVSGGIETLLSDHHSVEIHEDTGSRLWRLPPERERLLIFAHEGTNSVLISHLIGVEPVPWTHLRFSGSWAGITRLHTVRIGSRYVWSLEAFNRVEHLECLSDQRAGGGRSSSF